MLLNCKQFHKNFNEQCLHLNVCQLSLLTFKMVLMTLMLALMKVYFSLLYAQWRIWMPKSVIECWLKWKNRNWIWFMRKCSYFRAIGRTFALLVAVWRKFTIACFLVMNSKRWSVSCGSVVHCVETFGTEANELVAGSGSQKKIWIS